MIQFALTIISVIFLLVLIIFTVEYRKTIINPKNKKQMRRFKLKFNKGQWHFNLLANNNELILTSETYKQKEGALNGINSVKLNSQKDEQYSFRVSVDGKDYFVLKGLNGEIIGTSEMYNQRSGMLNGVESVKENAPLAEIVIIDETSKEEE
jgi:uncharacterized protein YegP (UPF0339 family)